METIILIAAAVAGIVIGVLAAVIVAGIITGLAVGVYRFIKGEKPLKVAIFNRSKFDMPKYATEGSAGMDLMANEGVIIYAGESKKIPTGIHIALPKGYEAQIRPRSSLFPNKGLLIPNSPATIDSDYRGEIMILVYNPTGITSYIEAGNRIAQLVIAKVEQCEWVPTSELEETKRGKGGFGSTGK